MILLELKYIASGIDDSIEMFLPKTSENTEVFQFMFLSQVPLRNVCSLYQKLQKMSQLTREQRYTISEMYKQGFSRKSIADTIGKDKSVVSREIKRNSDEKGRYRFSYAHEQAVSAIYS